MVNRYFMFILLSEIQLLTLPSVSCCTTALTDFSNFGRGSKSTLPHFKHLIRKSTPTRITSHRSPPHGWAFLVLTTSPTAYLWIADPP